MKAVCEWMRDKECSMRTKNATSINIEPNLVSDSWNNLKAAKFRKKKIEKIAFCRYVWSILYLYGILPTEQCAYVHVCMLCKFIGNGGVKAMEREREQLHVCCWVCISSLRILASNGVRVCLYRDLTLKIFSGSSRSSYTIIITTTNHSSRHFDNSHFASTQNTWKSWKTNTNGRRHTYEAHTHTCIHAYRFYRYTPIPISILHGECVFVAFHSVCAWFIQSRRVRFIFVAKFRCENAEIPIRKWKESVCAIHCVYHLHECVT